MGASSTPSESVVVGRILDMTPGVDVPDELEERWSRSFATLSSLTQKASPAEVQDMLQKRVSSSDSLCAEVFAGLLFGILSANSTKEAEALLEHINLLVLNTGFKALSSELEQLMSCFARHRLLHSSRMMLLWLTSQLAPRGVPCFPALCGSLLRQCYAGDLSSNNLDFTKAFLRLVEEHKEVIFAEPKLVMAILYVCLCLILDHCSSSSEALKSPMTSTLVEMEGKMACDILEEKGEACVELGRDLIRCLEGAAKVSSADTAPVGTVLLIALHDYLLHPSGTSSAESHACTHMPTGFLFAYIYTFFMLVSRRTPFVCTRSCPHTHALDVSHMHRCKRICTQGTHAHTHTHMNIHT